MADDTTIIWTSVPLGSRLQLRCDGDKDDFDVSALVTLNGQPRPNLEKDDISPGPATIAIDATKQRWEVLPSLIVMTALATPLTLQAQIVNPFGTVINVPDGNGNQIPAKAQWQSPTTEGALLEIAIHIRSVKS